MYPVDTIKTRMQALGHPGQRARLCSGRSPYKSHIHSQCLCCSCMATLSQQRWQQWCGGRVSEACSGALGRWLLVPGAHFNGTAAQVVLQQSWRCLPWCRPSHALYFAAYEASKEAFGGNEPGYQVVATGAAGIIATLVNDTIMTPVDVVKQRLQVGTRSCVPDDEEQRCCVCRLAGMRRRSPTHHTPASWTA